VNYPNKYPCPHCGHIYNSNNRRICPECDGAYIAPEEPEDNYNDFTRIGRAGHLVGEYQGPQDSKRIAIESAKIVNTYGAILQIFGIIIGVLVIIGGILLANSTGTGSFAFVGIVLGLLDIAIFAVQGAIFRMVSNYVIARLENSTVD